MPQTLPTTILGRTGLRVTRLGYGAAHNKAQTEDNARLVHEAVLDAGINYIDTADDYGNSEELIGRFISARSSEFYIATKCAAGGTDPSYFGGSPSGHIWTRENCMRTLEESLRRMRRDSVDVMQLHSATIEETEQGHLVEALQEMKEQGKVRWIGASTGLPDMARFIDWGVFDVFQVPYSALERDHEDFITRAAEAGAGIIIRGGIALGEPGAGKGGTGSPDSQRSAGFWRNWPTRWKKFEEAGLDELMEEGDSRTAFTLRFTLSHPHTHAIIVGTTSTDHLRENAEAVRRGPLPPDIYAEAKRRLDGVGVRPVAAD
jgi:aryl-alcohol dehydrogenase-like predicted oxidoreductase